MGACFEALCMGVLRKVSDLGCIFFVSKPLDLNNVNNLVGLIACLLNILQKIDWATEASLV